MVMEMVYARRLELSLQLSGDEISPKPKVWQGNHEAWSHTAAIASHI
jgi:hypothetical protein